MRFKLNIKVLILVLCFPLPGIYSQMLGDTLKLDEVVVTGSRVEVSRKNLPVNVTVIGDDKIDEMEESAALSILGRRIPGLFVTERGIIGYGVGSSSAGQVSIRGVGGSPNTQVLMLIDGHPQYMGIFGHPLPNSYVASDLERIEVIKGPASILYGSNAMGGVINFITKKQNKEGFNGEARASYGSFDTRKYMVNGGFRKKGFSMMLSYNHDQTDGHRDSSSFNIDNGYMKAGYDFSDHISITADFNIAKFNNLDPGPDFKPARFEADIQRGKASVFIKNTYKKAEGGLMAFYNFGEHVLSDGWRSNDSNYGLSVYESLKLVTNNLISLGIDYKNFGGEGNSGMAANKWNSITEIAGYAVVQQKLFQKLNLSAGLRIENNSEFGNELIPQLGGSYGISEKTTLKASYSKGFRSPTIMETYLFMPNPELKPERSHNYELSLIQSFVRGRLNTELTAFLVEGSNIIQVVPNENPPPPMKRLNTGEFNHKGFEIEADFAVTEDLTTELSYSYLNMDSPKLAAPENQLFLNANYRWNKFILSVNANYIGGLYARIGDNSGSNPDILENYFLLNTRIKYMPAKVVEIFLSGKNLTDKKYQIDNGYPMPGINFTAGVGVKF